ncbi:flagellar hook-basal body complex protein FliE [Biostraticola tofi]|uniref:Flagellar hook-basal body complex protein FliE n=1 Tax=Biostraticola tofi TaxID=466109 RepID=A0A4R3YWB4_9GAMM|nr:flagellar hook-basal body complex protein FliE [Biostraticola tofi]TCV95563.1 flagellar hook-basal body complex protein FliE [Biostraticola tofi]
MSVQAINNVLQQMQAVAQQAGNISTDRAVQSGMNLGFASEIKNSIKKINHVQVTARHQAEQFELGVPGIGMNDVMVDIQKSSLALNLGVQVRNKLVGAYQEIMNMQV